MPTKIALIRPNQLHIDCIRNIEDVQLTAVVDVIRRDNQLMEEGLILSDYRVILTDKMSDGVIVCGNGEYCHEVLINCARAGKSILCETPILSHSQARKIWAICQAYNVLLGVSFPHRLSPDQAVVRQKITKSELGSFQAINIIKRNNSGLNYRSTVLTPDLPYRLEIGINLIDTLRWLFDSEFTQVRPPIMVNESGKGKNDLGKWILKMNNGLLVRCDFDPFVSPKEERTSSKLEIEILGSEGRPVLRFPLKTVSLENVRNGKSLNSAKDLICGVMRNFVRAIQGEQPIVATGLDMLRAHEVLEAIHLAKNSKDEVFI